MDKEGEWMDVALTNQTRFDARFALKHNPLLAIAEKKGFVNVDETQFEKAIDVQPGRSYKFRVAAVNSCGVGPWSEVTAYRSFTPGSPEAPTTVRVNKTDTGARVSWDARPTASGMNPEFGVFLAVNVINDPTKLNFDRVYCGFENSCEVTDAQLKNALIDNSAGKRAVIFRIASKTGDSYGSATQVRWLQS